MRADLQIQSASGETSPIRGRALILAILLLASGSAISAEPPLPVWPDGTPGALGKSPRDVPTLTAYLPPKPNGSALLLIPGGSYQGIYEGQADPFARWLNEQGITVLLLRYRLGAAGYRYPAQLQDAVESIRTIRRKAAQWNIQTNRVGVMGFSAGGHLVSTLINRPQDGDIPGRAQPDPVSSRPDLAILCYPVISMITQPHVTSRENLIGTSPSELLLQQTSSELQVHPGLPPCFLWHTAEDKLVPVEHAQLYATALQRNSVPHEFHLYQHGDHGTGLMGSDHPWMQDLLHWLKAQKFLEPRNLSSEL